MYRREIYEHFTSKKFPFVPSQGFDLCDRSKRTYEKLLKRESKISHASFLNRDGRKMPLPFAHKIRETDRERNRHSNVKI